MDETNAGPMDLPVMPLERLMALVDAHVDDARLHCNGLAARSEVAASRVKLNDALAELIYPCCELLAHCDENPPMGDSLWSVRQIRAALRHNAETTAAE
ncbi:hypothetical protein [Rhodoferax antarcticus]|uniref:hypothetical protein n=1 Tax=Rhodoferax antarcticus TaxID=81479 RepID=UPI000AC106FC|nr:hypothetical protein [Rhodoferax antarcticus]